jgi:hypothetical protein
MRFFKEKLIMYNYKYVLLLDRAYLLKSLDELERYGYDPNKDTLYELGRKIRVINKPVIEEVTTHPTMKLHSPWGELNES